MVEGSVCTGRNGVFGLGWRIEEEKRMYSLFLGGLVWDLGALAKDISITISLSNPDSHCWRYGYHVYNYGEVPYEREMDVQAIFFSATNIGNYSILTHA